MKVVLQIIHIILWWCYATLSGIIVYHKGVLF